MHALTEMDLIEGSPSFYANVGLDCNSLQESGPFDFSQEFAKIYSGLYIPSIHKIWLPGLSVKLVIHWSKLLVLYSLFYKHAVFSLQCV